ncbi:helix-turn-helix domain-containing protein [Nocardiopsis valliformis]|uniref:helix-turn-helix domain-containing protein n=1 Tax=Nocardiopsis valliformis TaxID=239974 RepID=UPI0004767734|nr:helix-turn-helix transcriptional regulator [Nocardiopsis valliformis]
MTTPQAKKRFGRELARNRKRAGMTQAKLGTMVEVSTSHLSNLEGGYRSPALPLLPRLDEVLGTGTRLQDLWDDLTGTGRPAWLDEVTNAIQNASAVYEYQVLAFPAHLQTEAYTRALMRYGAPWLAEDEVNVLVAERMTRAEDLAGATTPKLWLVVDESLLSRRYGGAEVTRAQLEYIAELAERERLTLQVVPVDSPKHPGNSGAFSVIVTQDSPDSVYVENAREGQSVTEADEVAHRRMLFAALQAVALTPDSSLERVREEIKRLDKA